MANIKQLDPGASPLHYFGSELRRLRREAGLTLDQLGERLYCTGSLIGQIETADRNPTKDFIERADRVLDANGSLLRLWPLVSRSRLPRKHQQVAELEAAASHIFAFQPQLVHGLLQTEAYARAVLGVLDHDDLDTRLEAWMARKRVLTCDAPPLYWVVLDEAVLHHEVGSPEVMREQLTHLLGYVGTKRVQIQVLPNGAGALAGLHGEFWLLSFYDQPSIVYGAGCLAQPTADPAEFAEHSLGYDLLRAAALSIEDSARLIARVVEERYEPRPRTDDPLA